MAALVVVTMGVFSSCKDYDDDINANTALINQLQSQVKALEEARQKCEQNIQTLTAAAAAAQATADQAVEAAKKAQAAADAAQGTADQAVKDAAAAQAAADAAQAAADAAAKKAETEAEKAKLAAIEEAQKKVDALYEKIKAEFVDIETFEKKLADKADVKYVNEKLAGVGTRIDSLAAKLKSCENDVAKKYKEIKDELAKIYEDYVTKKDFEAALLVVNAEIAALGQGIARIDMVNQRQSDSIAANFAAITVLQEQILQVEKNKKAIEALTDRVKALEDADFIKSADLNDATSAIRVMMAAVVAAATDKLKAEMVAMIEELDGKLSKLDGRVADNTKNIELNKQAIADLQDAMQKADKALSLRIDSLAAVTKALDQNKVDWGAFNTLANTVAGHTGQITTLTTWMNNVKANVDKIPQMLADITKAQETADKAKATAEAAQKAAANAQADADSLAKVTQALEKRAENMEKDIAKKYSYLLDSIGVVAKNLKDLKSDVEKLSTRVESLEKGLAKLTSDLNKMFLFLDRDLTSIVTLPDEWIYGLPRIDAMIVESYATYTLNEDPIAAAVSKAKEQGYMDYYNEDQKSLESLIMTPGDGASKAFDINAKYWLNPQTVDTENYTFGFDEIPTKNTISRGDHDYDKAVPQNIRTKYSGDTLYVTFNVKAPENINSANTEGGTAYGETYRWKEGEGDDAVEVQWHEGNETYAWITTLALTATRNNSKNPELESLNKLTDNRRIISDYAILTPSYIDWMCVANKAKYAGITKDIEVEHWNQGNQQYHTHTVFAYAWNEDQWGTYSFYLNRTDDDAVINLNDSLAIHYWDNAEGEKEWTIQQAKDKGFTVEYTILTDKAYFNNGDGKVADDGLVYVKADKRDNASTAGKSAIVLVQLKADGKTYTYGYVTILITNNSTLVPLELNLNLDCNTGDSIAWEDVQAKIEEKLGAEGLVDKWDTEFYRWEYPEAAEGVAGGFKKYTDKETQKAATNNEHGVISIHTPYNGGDDADVDFLYWEFSTDEVKAAFYDEDENPNFKSYVRYIKLVPTERGKQQGYEDIVIEITIKSVKYPEAGFAMKDRVQSWWYKENSTSTTSDENLRFEIHGNVEAVDNNHNTTWGRLSEAADDEFIFDVSNTFLHKEANGSVKEENKNKFVVVPLNGYEFDETLYATLYFDTEKYYTWDNLEVTKATDEVIKDYAATTKFQGASGQWYVLFLKDAGAKVLWAVKLGDEFTTAQEVVKLDGDYNRVATFQGYVYPKEGNAAKYEYAYDLLNHDDHLNVGAGETFTTHMVLDYEYCLPIKYENNKFDIKYLRPISAKMADGAERVDATDGGATIKLGELVSFTDWRVEKGGKTFDCSTALGLKYINYYGITAIKPNLKKAYTNVNTSDKDWNPTTAVADGWEPLSNYIPQALRFDFVEGVAPARWNGGDPMLNKLWETADDFKNGMGYIYYENNGLNVRTFRVALPITIIYDWGETKEDWFVVTIVNTKGQDIESRRF